MHPVTAVYFHLDEQQGIYYSVFPSSMTVCIVLLHKQLEGKVAAANLGNLKMAELPAVSSRLLSKTQICLFLVLPHR